MRKSEMLPGEMLPFGGEEALVSLKLPPPTELGRERCWRVVATATTPEAGSLILVYTSHTLPSRCVVGVVGVVVLVVVVWKLGQS